MFKKTIVLFMLLCLLISDFPVQVFAEDALLELSCPSAILIEAGTGRVLYEKEADAPRPMASVTKIMTMLLIMEAIDGGQITMDEMVTGSEYAKSMGGSTIYLDAGESLSVHDMLKGIAVASANDACVAMAEHICGSETAFVEKMNQRASELGMKNTAFQNTNGLDEAGHYSSARDIAIMSAELLKHPQILEFTTIWMDSLRGGKFQLANTNKLIRFYKGANGLKTGSTDDALFCLSGAAMRDGMQLIAVVLGAPTSPKRFSDTSKLLDYGFANYKVSNLVQKDAVMGEVAVEKGVSAKVQLLAETDFTHLLKKGEESKSETKIFFEESIKAPIEKGEKLGAVTIYENGKEIGSVALVAAHGIDKLKYGSMLVKVLASWIGVEA